MIRDFAAGDEAAVAALERECFSEPWSENAIIESLNSGTLFFLFEEAEEILGYAGLQVVLDEGYVTNIAVTEKARKRGIGSALTERILSAGREKALSFVSLEVRASNSAAISLYEKFGFKAVGVRKRFYANPTEDAIIMTVEGF
jgi:ribosomal-protein-alanine N-acetyltransferase